MPAISYTRFIEGSTASFDVSPFKNDFYASALYKKTWIRTGHCPWICFWKTSGIFLIQPFGFSTGLFI